MRRAGIILCGGRSSRMGGDKASLPFGRETLLARVLRRLAAMLDTVVVVAAARQPLPPSSRGIIVVRDSLANHGPLEGLRCGLAALSSTHEAALVTGCDVPFLSSAFVDCLFQRLGHAAAAVVYDPPHYWPLPAVYRRDLAPLCARLFVL